MQNLFALAGGQPQKPPKWTPLFIEETFTGLVTQRAPIHDPSDLYTRHFLGGRPDALWDGLNIELTNDNTLARRPGLSEFSSATYPTSPDRAFDFRLSDGTIQVLIDTESAVYIDNQDGTKTLLFTKSAGAGQTYFQSVADVCYMSDGVDLLKYTPGNANGLVWNWGIAAPATPPSVTITEEASASAVWSATTVFSTMGLTIDPNNNVQQLYSVNASGTNPPPATIGESGAGAPDFNLNYLETTTDGSVTWTSYGTIGVWAPSTEFASGSAIYDPTTNCIFIVANWVTVKSGTSRPAFNSNPFVQYIHDNQIKWICLGVVNATNSAVTLWQTDTAFNQYQSPPAANSNGPTHVQSAIVYPIIPNQATITAAQNEGTQMYLLGATTAGTTANTSYTPWTGIPSSGPESQSAGDITIDYNLENDTGLLWLCCGPDAWNPNSNFSQWTAPGTAFSCIYDGTNMQVCTTGGLSGTIEPGTTATLTKAEQSTPTSGQTTYLGTFSAPYSANMTVIVSGFVNAGNNGEFIVVSCSGTALVVENSGSTTEVHAGSVVWSPWGSTYGATTNDGAVVWTCVGPPVTWAANTNWYLPTGGFSPPQPSQQYGGVSVNGSGWVQEVISSGLSGSSAPTWGTSQGAQATDNGVTWVAEAPSSANSLSWTIGHVYAYSYKSRSTTDYYAAGQGPSGTTNIPPGLPSPNNPNLNPTFVGQSSGNASWSGTVLGAGTGGVSTASPVYTITGGNTGAVVTLSVPGSSDPQCDTVVFWRDADGGGPDEMYELTEVPNVPGGTVTFNDWLPDIASASSGVQYPGLDEEIPAPIDSVNNPPQAGFLPMANHFQRIWGAIGETAYFSGGPDVLVGNPNECFNPADEEPFLSGVVNLVHTPSGLITFLTSDIEIIAGGPQTESFYSTTLCPGVGCLSYNALDVHGGEIYFFSADGQFLTITPQLQLTRTGFAIGDKLAALDASAVYVAVHESGTDNCVFVGDGSTGWYRLNPHQFPGGMNGPEPIWSPYASITGGCKMLQSIEVSTGVHKLLVGGTGTNQNILERNLTVFSDNGTAYPSWFVMGGIVTAHPGELSVYGFIECDFAGRGSQPTVSYMIDEIPGVAGSPPVSFTEFISQVADPPTLYGPNATAATYYPNRYYFAQNTSPPNRGRFIFIKADYGDTDTVENEIWNLTIYGKTLVEK